MYCKDIIFRLSIKFHSIIAVCLNTVIKGEQAPQVADFTGLKSNPCNYSILFFLPGCVDLVFTYHFVLWIYAVIRGIHEDIYRVTIIVIFSKSSLFSFKFFYYHIFYNFEKKGTFIIVFARLYFPNLKI